MHYTARNIIRDQITYYKTTHWLATPAADKEKYAKLIIDWAAKLDESGD